MSDLVRAELVRLRTTRLWLWLAFGTVAGTMLTVATSITTAGDGGLPPLETSDGIRNVMNGATSGALVSLILGVVSMAGEFRHGTATSTFLVTPQRGRVVMAKLAVSALAGLVFAVGSSLLTLVIAVPWLDAKDMSVPVLSGDVWIVFTGALLATIFYAAAGVGVGALVRNQTLAVTGAVLWVTLVEGLVVQLLPEVGRWLPGGAATALTSTTTSEGGLLPAWGGGLLFAAYAAVIALAGVRRTAHRDVL